MGSGKTAVAFLALLAAAGSGHQGALMAPTEVLATQHAKSLSALLASLPAQLPGGRRRPTCALVTGGVCPWQGTSPHVLTADLDRCSHAASTCPASGVP